MNRVMSRLSKFDWSRLIPSFKAETFEFFGWGVETTWRTPGIGVGFGLGSVDIWAGWKRKTEA